MKGLFIVFVISAIAARAEVPSIPKSVSPDGKFYAVMDIDRDPKSVEVWNGESHPKIEITEKATKKIWVSIEYFGATRDDQRPIREHVIFKWRPDSRAFAITIHDTHFSDSNVYLLNKKSKFVSVSFPEYEVMTGFPEPKPEDLLDSAGFYVDGWDDKGRVIYEIFRSANYTFKSKDPLRHRIFLKVTETKMVTEKVEHETGHWKRGDWITEKKKPRQAK